MDIFGRTLQKNSFNRRHLHRQKTFLSLVPMSSADELLNGSGEHAFGCKSHFQGSSHPFRHDLFFRYYCLHSKVLLKDALMNENSHCFTQLQEWCFLLWSGIVWVMSPGDKHWYKLEHKYKLNLMNAHTIVLLLSVFVVVLSSLVLCIYFFPCYETHFIVRPVSLFNVMCLSIILK